MVARTDLLEAADSELLGLARAGESEAFGILYERHVAAGRQLAYQLASTPRLADDVVAEAFGRMQDMVARGGGPSSAVRPYVLTAVRRVCYERLHGAPGQPPAEGATLPDPDQLLVDPAVTGLDTALVARAYQSLPERSRAVLWHTEIEQDSPADVAALLGVTRNGVGALRRRAMDDLRQAYLQMHISLITQPGCRPVAERLGAFDRQRLTARDAALVSEHLARCESCQVVHRELTDITAAVRGVVAPLVLGPAAAAYLADAGHHGPLVTGGATGLAGPRAGTEAGADDARDGRIPAGVSPGSDVARLTTPGTALLPGPGQIPRPRRAHQSSLWGSARRAFRSRRVAAAVAAGAVMAATAGIALAMTLTGNDNAPASAGQVPPAPSRHAASAQPSLSPSASPSPAPSPAPSASASAPPPAPAAAPIRLTASLSISRHGASGHPDDVVFQVTNTGSAASGPLTAVIALPAGSSLFGNTSSAGAGGWNCQPASGGATCTNTALSAGQQAQGTLFITVSSSGACGQPVRLTVTSGGATAAASAAIPC